ncbi:SDR family oxidoreductase [Allokutzneria sp. A3M-2-11 16]|uniref:SDR family oxidoreductase n=1 Tax=Allokutzneria sp. A3M-2-11 16 TaxID=2962043 RepID=UPI0020B8CE8F|nr:SDR family oxidoreductase [Allokutzneria sp. A3M-2-11 16]MCP3802020.1 SDR family oxidoreductase [Allokutzneria sp. A3M-2-11 16]
MTSTVALVSGASRGIGAAIAAGLARRGHHVIVNYHRNADAAEQVVAGIEAVGGTAQAEQADVCDHTQATALVDRVRAEHGRVDVLVCSANTVPPPFEPLASLPWEAFVHKVVGELAGSYHLTQRVLPIMRDQRAGRIIYISSTVANTVGMLAAHSTAKAALNTFSRHVAADAGQYGVTVNTLALGAVNTDATADVFTGDVRASIAQRSVHGRVLEPEDVGAAVALLADGGFGSITGQVISLDAGFDVLKQQLAGLTST